MGNWLRQTMYTERKGKAYQNVGQDSHRGRVRRQPSAELEPIRQRWRQVRAGGQIRWNYLKWTKGSIKLF